MRFLDIIFGIPILILVFFTRVGLLGMGYDTWRYKYKLKRQNEKQSS